PSGSQPRGSWVVARPLSGPIHARVRDYVPRFTPDSIHMTCFMGLCSTSHIVPEVSGIAFKKCEEWRTDESFQAPIPESLPSPRSTTGDRRLLGGSAATTIPPRVASLEDWTCSTSHTLPEVSGIPFKQCEGCRIDES